MWWQRKRSACSPSLRLCHLHHDQKGQMPPASPAALPQKTCFFFGISFILLPLYLELALIFSWKVLRSLRSSPNFLFVLQDDSLCSLSPSCLVLTSHVNTQLTICVGWGCGSAAGVGTMWHQSGTQYSFKEIMGALWSWKSQDSFNENIWISVTKSGR